MMRSGWKLGSKASKKKADERNSLVRPPVDNNNTNNNGDDDDDSLANDVMNMEDDDSGVLNDLVAPSRSRTRRESSFRYMEEASMEVSLISPSSSLPAAAAQEGTKEQQSILRNDNSQQQRAKRGTIDGAGTTTATAAKPTSIEMEQQLSTTVTKIEASGRMGRRHTFKSNEDIIVVADTEKDYNQNSGRHNNNQDDLVGSLAQTTSAIERRRRGRDTDPGETTPAATTTKSVPLVNNDKNNDDYEDEEESERGSFRSVQFRAATTNRPASAATTNKTTTTLEMANAVAGTSDDATQRPDLLSAATPTSALPVYNERTQQLSLMEVLCRHGVLSQSLSTAAVHNTNNNNNDQQQQQQAWALYALMCNFCDPPVSFEAVQSILELEQQQHKRRQTGNKAVALPVQPVISVPTVPATTDKNSSTVDQQNCPVVALFRATTSVPPLPSPTRRAQQQQQQQVMSHQQPLLLQLPSPFVAAFLRLLIRLLTQETDDEYNQSCLIKLAWKEDEEDKEKDAENPHDQQESAEEEPTSTTPFRSSYRHHHRSLPQHNSQSFIDPDHSTRRPYLVYNVVRFQCTWMSSNDSQNVGYSSSSASSYAAVTSILNLWERVARSRRHQYWVGPLSRLLGIMAAAGLNPAILRRMMVLAQGGGGAGSTNEFGETIPLSPKARLSMVRALITATVGGIRWPPVLPKSGLPHFFSFAASAGLHRTMTGLQAWPFRNDFGMALWFRAEQFSSQPQILFEARANNRQDGGGIQVALVPLEDRTNNTTMVDDACTISVSVFDSLEGSKRQILLKNEPVQTLRVTGCVLLPRVWYHVAIRHTRSRLKGVFSLSTREQVSVFLDGKMMLTESLAFPKVGTNQDSTSLLMTSPLRRSAQASYSSTRLNLSLTFGENFDGQTGALYVFMDHVSDSTFRTLFETTGGIGVSSGSSSRSVSGNLSTTANNAGSLSAAKSSNSNTNEASRRSTAKALDSINQDDAEEMVLSNSSNNRDRRHLVKSSSTSSTSGSGTPAGSGSRRRQTHSVHSPLDEKNAAAMDMGEGGEDVEDKPNLPTDLQRSSFASKIFLAWDPRRCLDTIALELHVGAHVSLVLQTKENSNKNEPNAKRTRLIHNWSCARAQDVIAGIGGVQALIPLVRSFLSGDIERVWASASSQKNDGDDNDDAWSDWEAAYTAIPDLLRLVAAFVQNHSVNAREMIRCGGVDVLEQLLFGSKRLAKGDSGATRPSTLFGALTFHKGVALQLAQSLLTLEFACAHIPILETRVFSRLLMNLHLWLGAPSGTVRLGSALHLVLLPVLSSCAKLSAERVRDYIGVGAIVQILKEYSQATVEGVEGGINRFESATWNDAGTPLRRAEQAYATSIVLGMIYNILVIGDVPRDFSSLLHWISFQLDESGLNNKGDNVNSSFAIFGCLTLLFLIQIRPPVPGLFERMAETCGGVQSIAGWVLRAMVNCRDDTLRSVGILFLASLLNVVAKDSDSPLLLGGAIGTTAASLQPSLEGTAPIIASASTLATDVVTSSMLRASSGLGLIAKGLAAIGPLPTAVELMRQNSLTARVVCKLLWHLLKSQRDSLSTYTRAALISWITQDNSILSTNLSSAEYLEKTLIVQIDQEASKVPEQQTTMSGYRIDFEWAQASLDERGRIVGKSLEANLLALGTVLRLLRYLQNDQKDQWLADLLVLVKSNRRSVSVLSSLTDWQPCLFPLISETLETINEMIPERFEKQDLESQTNNAERDSSEMRVDVEVDELNHPSHVALIAAQRRLDVCLDLYSTVLGHIFREGGDKAVAAVERAASLQRIYPNGREVLLLILSGLCSDLFEHGTLLELGSISAEDWKELNLENESLLLKQSARLVTDAILFKGTRGLDMTTAVRSWRSLRHLTEVIVAVITRSGFGVMKLLDYINQQASSVDSVSGGLHGIYLGDGRLNGVSAADYCLYTRGSFAGTSTDKTNPDEDSRRDVNRRLCVKLAAQIMVLLDAFIFPESLDPSNPNSQIHGLTLVRNSEVRLGTAQGPLVSSLIRLSCLLLAILEPCSVRFLQCVSRLRSLLMWALALIGESSGSASAPPAAIGETVAHLDRLILAIVLHCHRALGRCAALVVQIELSSFEKYFSSKEMQKKVYKRLLRATLELREVTLAALNGRKDVIQNSLSSDAFDSLQQSLNSSQPSNGQPTKESPMRDFLSSSWVASFQDVDNRLDLTIPEQIDFGSFGNDIGSDYSYGIVAIEKLEREASALVSQFEKAIDGEFEVYLEEQRKWAETDAVRELEVDSDNVFKKMKERHKGDENELLKVMLKRKQTADHRWRAVVRKAVDPFKQETHWKLARFTDRRGRRMLLVPNVKFNSRADASYDGMTGAEGRANENALAKKDFTEVMRRNAEAFVVSRVDSEEVHAEEGSGLEEEIPSDMESSVADAEETQAELRNESEKGALLDDSENDEEWDKIDNDEIKHIDAEGDVDAWAKTFIWAEGESVVERFEPVVIVSLQSFVAGKALLTTHGLYFHQVDEETSVITKEPVDGGESGGQDRRWRLSRLLEVHGRRWMLRQQALELFFSDSHELFLNFPGGIKERDRFYSKLRSSCKVPMLWSPKSLNPRTVFRRSKLTELWRRRKISNYDYIMALNRMAGRSFNDITQYPVFPWILADYTSETITLSDSRVYRDLTKPVGALNPDRLAQLLERYKDLELFGFPEAEKFLYGSHYSSPGIILHYMVRQEPFTTMAIDLQSGRFDCPDRLFYDIEASWNSCMTSTSDVRELIPEFFCLPEMLLNTNNFPLGRTQTGRVVHHVGLPPWAKGSAYEFVRIHRQALESEYVSQNLHHWIDLIFGYKQRGREAEAAHNVFHHLSYEGSVDLEKIVDEVDRAAAESHIQNFGQTPSQLSVLEPHPSRYSADECWKPLIFDETVPQRLRCHTPAKQFGNKSSEHANGALIKIHVLSDVVVAIYADMSVGTYRWAPELKTSRLRMDKLRPLARRDLSTSKVAIKRGSVIPASEMTESTLAVGNWTVAVTLGGFAKEELRRKAVIPSNRLMTGSETTIASAEASALLVSCGYFDESIKVHGLDSLRLISSSAGGHRGSICCLDVGEDGGLMATGGEDGTVRIWVVDHPDMTIALSDGYVQTALGASNDGEQLLNCCHVLWGHEYPVSSVVVGSDLDVVVSGSQSGLVCIHTIRQGEFIRSFRPASVGNTSSIRKLALGTNGTLIVHTQDQGLHSYTLNGVRLCSTHADEYLHDLVICSGDEMLVTGGDHCQVLVRTVFDLNIVAMLDLSRHGPIRCIALTPNDLNPVKQNLFIGSDDGMLTIVEDDSIGK